MALLQPLCLGQNSSPSHGEVDRAIDDQSMGVVSVKRPTAGRPIAAETGLASSEARGRTPVLVKLEELGDFEHVSDPRYYVECLETTKQSGLLSEYLVSWTGRAAP